MKILLWFVVTAAFLITTGRILVEVFFGPVSEAAQITEFIVPEDSENFNVTKELFESQFIKNEKAFDLLVNTFAKDKEIKSGGYRLSQNMNAWEVMEKITANPDLLWVTISFCPRKEQVGEKLASTLGWDQAKLDRWNLLYKTTKPEYFEGVYYPDTYLIPVDETETQVARRFINRFNEKFEPLAKKFLDKNIKWTSGIKIASLIAREAAGVNDMGLVSGVIWNRLDTNMRLQIDATMQYTLGKNDDGSWWGTIDLDEKRKDSPYNTYLHKGLPPTPICSPNIDAIEAALNPEETECLFYLHDETSQIHCAETYQEHLDNIRKYL